MKTDKCDTSCFSVCRERTFTTNSKKEKTQQKTTTKKQSNVLSDEACVIYCS